jgi:hypothetical protein
MEIAGAVQEVAELRARKAVRFTLDLGRAAAPWLPFDDRPVTLHELPVERAVMRDHDRRVVDERVHRRIVYPVTGHHLVGNAGQRHDLVGDRACRLVEGGKCASDACDPAVGQVAELEHPEFDDFVLSGVEASGLGI